ncbi:activating signal cointegrator 1 complex subunit 2 [Anopheles ziemanni]|uniref:activating signal cointegrator 1 complex subunit 2 n=1 Tax=Anopheles coustani TaxID=139045 RepID=UPI00265A98CB|nr:activating signal cointegrator 1 complex subunit 2 [Anopheles coustani]XP_058175862.1 activating signal cointegrator 1 complex subunit 2 [Anopheles ziemanni]
MANKPPTKMKENQPLNKQKITVDENGVKIPIAALHTNWKESRCFTKYSSLKVDLDGSLILEKCDQWMDETTWFIKDIKCLLGLQYHKFWSTIVYNPSALESILSFVQNALPTYLELELNSNEKQQSYALYLDARSYVLKVICRFTAAKEEKSSWIESDFLANLLYKHFIVTVPFMLDVITVYGRDNQEEVSRIIEFILHIQPKYQQDFRQGLQYLTSVLAVIQNRCEMELLRGVSEAALKDLALYAQDCAYTLSVMLEISPTLRQICADLNCEFAISNFYDNAVLMIYQKIQENNENSSYLPLLNGTRVELLEAFRSIVTVQLDKILSGSGDSLLAADKFISILTECLANNVFVNDYKRRYETDDDLQIVQMGFKSVDKVKFDFIQKAYTLKEDDEATMKEQQQTVDFETEVYSEYPQSTDYTDETNDNNLEQQKQLNLATIMDLLPHLEIEHVKNVVDRYDNVEEAIAVLLEQNHSEENQHTDPNAENQVIIPNDPLDEFYVKTGIDRLNIYDGDEFDVMVNDKVKGVMKRGKGMPGDAKSLNELLDDKSHVRQMRHFYQRFDMIADIDPDDDEYDDSFEAMAESESRHVRVAKGANNVLADNGLDDESESENEDEPVELEANRNPTLAFCENPEVSRKRYEEKLHSKYLRRHGTVAQGKAPESKGGDVRGKPKGQGQDAKVLQNRKNKNENKSSVGNHNRKQGASYKRNRGMLPS